MSTMQTRGQNRFERRKQDTRRRLKQATIELILEKGYDAVTVQDITDRADLGRGTFYVHYTDKEDIVWSILYAGFASFEQGMDEQYGGVLGKQREYLTWKLIFEYAAQNRDLYRVMLGGKGSALLTERVQKHLAGVIETQIRMRGFFAGLRLPAEYIAQFVTGALMRLAIWWLETPNGYTPEHMAGMFHEMVYHEAP